MSALRSAITVAAGLTLGLQTAAAAGGGVTISSYGQRALLIQGADNPSCSILTVPWAAQLDCQSHASSAGVILASSELADEGARGVASGRFMAAPGPTASRGPLTLEGFANPHDRLEGRRFGNANIGAAEAEVELTKSRTSAPPLAPSAEPTRCCWADRTCSIIGVGGGSKIYDGNEAAGNRQKQTESEARSFQFSTSEGKHRLAAIKREFNPSLMPWEDPRSARPVAA